MSCSLPHFDTASLKQSDWLREERFIDLGFRVSLGHPSIGEAIKFSTK